MVTSAARTLLLVHLGAGPCDFRTGLCLVRALLLACKLIADHALKDVVAWLQTENLFGEFQLAGVRAFKCCNREIHYSAPSVVCATSASDTAAAAFAASSINARRPAGFGAFSGSATLTASRTRIHAPFEPGTAPRTRIRPRSRSVETTSMFWVVIRVEPI